MNLQTFRDYCSAKPWVSQELPFDENTLCFKVCGKIFAICDLYRFESINLKCDPNKAIELRASYSCVSPGYHTNKKHWNTIALDGEMSEKELKKWIDHSYDLVWASLPKKLKSELNPNL
jgi:predicted DNA-binding protein (MmcQ/YjbR family)